MAKKLRKKSSSKPGSARAAKPKAVARGKAKPAARGDTLQDFCRSLPGATEDIKWGADRVFSVGKKMFAAFDADNPSRFGFKCTEEDQFRLTELDGIIPAPYAARFGWVSIVKKGALPQAAAKQQLKTSYDLVFAGLPKRLQHEVRGSSPAR